MARSLPSFRNPWVEHAVWGAVRFALKVTKDPIDSVLDPRTHAEDPYAAYARLRDEAPVLKGRFPGTYVVAGHAAASHVLRHHHVGAPPDGEKAPWQEWDTPLSPSLLDLDPPDHTRIRRLVAQAFTPRAIAGLRDRAREVGAALLDDIDAASVVDLVSAFAQPLPITMICGMLGIRDDETIPAHLSPRDEGPTPAHEAFVWWGEDIALSLEPRATPRDRRRIDTSGEELGAYFRAHFDQRRAAIERGDAPDDVLTNLLQATEDGVGLSEQELVATCILLLGAGFETTVNLIGNGVLGLSRNPEQRDHLVEAGADAVPNAVEEFLRHDAPVQFTGRMTWDDDTIAGVEVPAGSTVLTLLGGANRDPAVFDAPDELDVTRDNAKDHLSFSLGPHHCLGAALARLEAEVAFELLLDRFPGMRLAAPARRRGNTVLRGLETLPVAW